MYNPYYTMLPDSLHHRGKVILEKNGIIEGAKEDSILIDISFIDLPTSRGIFKNWGRE